MDAEKLDFLRNKFVPLLQNLEPDAKGRWGVLNGQQMVEHFSDALRNASGKLHLPRITPDEHLPKMREFLMSEKPFKENTKNPLMSEQPLPATHALMIDSINELQQELNEFFAAFEKNPALTTGNAFFGSLNYEQNVHLLHKHAQHHLKQFGLIE